MKSTHPDPQAIVKVYAICSDMDIPDRDARLFSYIYTLAITSDKGLGVFNEPQTDQIAALGFLIGQLDFKELLSSVDDSETGLNMEDSLLEYIEQIETKGESNEDLKNNEEIFDRLRLHLKKDFRNEKLDDFKRIIEPRVAKYSDEMVQEAFLKFKKP